MTDEKIKRRRGCFFYGCIISSLLLVILLVTLLVTLRYAKKVFNDFTDTKPLTLPQVQLPQSELDELQRRIDTFRDGVKQGQPVGPLTLTADELNALIATDPDLKALKGKLYIMMEADQLKAQVSIPMDQLGLPMFKGRFFNGNGTFNLTFQNGMIRLSPQSFMVKGKPVPEVYMESIRKQNLAEDLNHDPRGKAAMDKLQEIKIQENKLVFVPK
jgi:hypothetical protein